MSRLEYKIFLIVSLIIGIPMSVIRMANTARMYNWKVSIVTIFQTCVEANKEIYQECMRERDE